ncbi:MAG: hypothetical protein IKJ99_07685 [Oscillospiraceae bacterium]|nr:hypothetical protein [Oscillospiraceae bacterium]
MSEQKNTVKLELMDILIGMTIVICLVFCHAMKRFGVNVEALAVTTGALMCVQDTTKSAWTTSLTRVLGVFWGGLFGVIVVLMDNAIGIPGILYLLCGISVIANLLVCKCFKMIYVQARVSCLTQILVVLCMEGADRLEYAFVRFIGSLVGALMALLITVTFGAIVKIARKL